MKHIKPINRSDIKKNDNKNGYNRDKKTSGPSSCRISCTVASAKA